MSYQINQVLKPIIEILNNKDVNLYLVGGQVRDSFLNKTNQDFDLMVATDFNMLIDLLEKKLGLEFTYHDKFLTATTKFASFELDIARARTEYYPAPGSLPIVSPASIKEDLKRRDFSVNAMAIQLNGSASGRLLDPFQGRKDISNLKLRSLHATSYLDDPTRILRGIKLILTHNFSFCRKDRQQIKDLLHLLPWKVLSLDRVFNELRKVLNLKTDISQLAELLTSLNVLKLLDPDYRFTKYSKTQFILLEEFLKRLSLNEFQIRPWLLRMAVLLQESKLDLDQLSLKKDEIKLISFTPATKVFTWRDNLSPTINIYNLFKQYSLEEIILLLINRGKFNIIADFNKYLKNYYACQIKIDGADLKRLGISPGPIYQEIFAKLMLEKFKKNVDDNKNAEIKFVKDFFSKKE